MKKTFILVVTIIIALGTYWIVTQDWRGNDNLKYTNIKHGYGFQYSLGWNLMGDSQADIVMLYNSETPPGDGGVPAGVKVDIMVLENYDSLSLEDWIEQMSQNGPEEEVLMQENTTVAGLSAVRKITSPFFDDINEGAPISVYFSKDNYIFAINYLGSEPEYSQEMGNFELLLKSFNLN